MRQGKDISFDQRLIQSCMGDRLRFLDVTLPPGQHQWPGQLVSVEERRSTRTSPSGATSISEAAWPALSMANSSPTGFGMPSTPRLAKASEVTGIAVVFSIMSLPKCIP
ncbi:hypothetical protein A9K65_032970 (plasmid) [Mesorhizobium sp. WSM1497]|nr:hypothetical protein A9K65_032970 [Mesorhizobium sp. WSM1497]